MQLGITAEFPSEIGFAKVEETTRAVLADNGFGILTEIDVKATLKKKIDVDVQNYKILGACNPPRAHKVISANPEYGLLLPCNVIVYETEDGKVKVSATSAGNMFTALIQDPRVEEVANEVQEIFVKVIDEIKNRLSQSHLFDIRI